MFVLEVSEFVLFVLKKLLLLFHQLVHGVDTPSVTLLSDILLPSRVLVKEHLIQDPCLVGLVRAELAHSVNLVVQHPGFYLVGVAAEDHLLKYRLACHDRVVSSHQSKSIRVDLLDLADCAEVELGRIVVLLQEG